MIIIARGLAAGAVLAGAAVGLASPASAEPPSGEYTATVIDGLKLSAGKSEPATLTQCGADCTHLQLGQIGSDLHPQGDSWSGAFNAGYGDCTFTVDNTSLVLTEQCGAPFPVSNHYQLTKNS
jgi:hypothetical protein